MDGEDVRDMEAHLARWGRVVVVDGPSGSVHDGG